MQDFIKELYDKAFIIQDFEEFIFLTESFRYSEARDRYNKAAAALEQLLEKTAESDLAKATHIQSVAIEIKEHFDDHCFTKGLIRAALLPELYSMISQYASIDVSEGKYTIQNSDSGFLSIRDNESGIFLHDTFSPMNEAYRNGLSLYKPGSDNILIFGCGLGYLAYQIYCISKGSVRIRVYEEDDTIIGYAYEFGVLSLIPDDILTVVHNSDLSILADKFLHDLHVLENREFVFSHWKKPIYKALNNDILNRLIINRSFEFESYGLSVVNLSKNRQLSHIRFNDIADRFDYDEWITISAGPSFDNCVEFLKSSMGSKGLIAVNTVLKRIYSEGIIPDIVVAADQFDALESHIKGIEPYTDNTFLVADWSLCWKYARLYRGPICFVRTNADLCLSDDLLKNEPVWDVSGTVACLAIETAARLNARKIYMVGQDLAYPAGQKYAANMPQELSPGPSHIQVKSVDGSLVETCEAFKWFRKAIESQIRKYDQIEFINMSEHGAYIDGALAYER